MRSVLRAASAACLALSACQGKHLSSVHPMHAVHLRAGGSLDMTSDTNGPLAGPSGTVDTDMTSFGAGFQGYVDDRNAVDVTLEYRRYKQLAPVSENSGALEMRTGWRIYLNPDDQLQAFGTLFLSVGGIDYDPADGFEWLFGGGGGGGLSWFVSENLGIEALAVVEAITVNGFDDDPIEDNTTIEVVDSFVGFTVQVGLAYHF